MPAAVRPHRVALAYISTAASPGAPCGPGAPRGPCTTVTRGVTAGAATVTDHDCAHGVFRASITDPPHPSHHDSRHSPAPVCPAPVAAPRTASPRSGQPRRCGTSSVTPTRPRLAPGCRRAPPARIHGSGSQPRLSHALRTVRRVSLSTCPALRSWRCELPSTMARCTSRPVAVGYMRARSVTIMSSVVCRRCTPCPLSRVDTPGALTIDEPPFLPARVQARELGRERVERLRYVA